MIAVGCSLTIFGARGNSFRVGFHVSCASPGFSLSVSDEEY